MADIRTELNEKIKALGEQWTRCTVVGSFLLYFVGYLALRFHLTTIGVGTDLAVLDERYLFTGARFFVYLVSTLPILVFVAYPLALVVLAVAKIIPETARTGIREWIMHPMRLALFGIVFAVFMIQFVMRKCFVFSNLLLARSLPKDYGWLSSLLLNDTDTHIHLYFILLVGGCAVSLAILWAVRKAETQSVSFVFAKGLLAFLVAVQILLLPINYGVLIVDKVMPRVATLGAAPLAFMEDAWLVWEGKDGVTFLVQSREQKRRALVTLPRTEVKRIEIIGYDRILPVLFNN